MNTKSNTRLTVEQMEAIADVINNGGSNRQAAREVLDKESRESTIRNAISRGDIKIGIPKALPIKQAHRTLIIDIETAPILGNVWSLWKQNVGLNQIHKDWYILSYSAKWEGEDEIMYSDKRDSYDDEDDSELLQEIWELLDEADIVCGQNSQKFDTKKINARLIFNGFKPPSPYRQVDTMLMAKRHFGFTSNKLEYMTDKLCTRYKKLDHGKFAGFNLWKACLAGNQEAWQEMQDYNSVDVLSTEELYHKLRPWVNNHPNINVYTEEDTTLCTCGHDDWTHSGYHYTNLSKFDKFKCNNCGATQRGRVNLIPKNKRKGLKANVV